MTRKIMIACILTILLVGGIILKTKYAEWFIYPPLRAHVVEHLKDPASTQYRNERITNSGWLCGELNSKNSMGAYTGFKRYISGGKGDAYLESLGPAGNPSKEDVLALLNKEIEFLKQVAELQKTIPNMKIPTETERHEVATQKFFDEKWGKICGT